MVQPLLENQSTILLAIGPALIRRTIRTLLGTDSAGIVVGEASEPKDALARARLLRPDIVILDLGDGPGEGLRTIEQIVQMETGARVLVTGEEDEADRIIPVLEAGGSGYLRQRNCTAERLRGAVRSLSNTGLYLTPASARGLLGTEAASGGSATWEGLDGKEREILALVAGGCTATGLDERFSLPATSPRDRCQHLMEALELRHRSDAVSVALRAGLLRVHP